MLVPLFLPAEARAAIVVLTRRRADLRRHAGEISFPGGRRDAEDADLRETALREAEEEIGLPRELVTLLGELPADLDVRDQLPDPPVRRADPGRAELARVAARGRRRARAAAARRPRRAARAREIERRGFTFETDAYILDGHLIWGATFRIIEDLLEQLRGGRLRATPACCSS